MKKFFAAFLFVLCIASQASAEIAVARGMPVRLLGAVLEEIREPVKVREGTIHYYGDADFGFAYAYGPGFVVTDESGAVIEVGRVLGEGASKAQYEALRDSLASYRHDYESGETNELGFTWGGRPDEDEEIDVTMSERTDGDRIVWTCELASGITEEVEVWRVIFDGANSEILASRVLFDGFASHDSAAEKIFALEGEPLKHEYDDQGNGSFVEREDWTREDAVLSNGMTLRTYRRGGAVAQYLIDDGQIRKSRWRARGFTSLVPGIASGTPEADLFGRCSLAEAREGAAECGLSSSMLAKMGEGNAYWYQERHGGSFILGIVMTNGGRADEFMSVSSFGGDDALSGDDIAKMDASFQHKNM